MIDEKLYANLLITSKEKTEMKVSIISKIEMKK